MRPPERRGPLPAIRSIDGATGPAHAAPRKKVDSLITQGEVAMSHTSVAAVGLLVVGLAVAGCAQQPAVQADTGWITLLDGPNGLENWNRVGTANWRVVDGVVQADSSEKGGGFLVTKDAYKDFRIRVEFWASDDANSGIYMRCQDPDKITDKSCYEANVFDQRPDPKYGTGAIVHHAAVSPMPKAGGKWNTYDITARGPRLTVTLNGVQTVDFAQGQFASGPVALQWGKGVVKFRKVLIRPL
jgi:hypothetical protein